MAKQLYALRAAIVFSLIYGIMLIVLCEGAASNKTAITARPNSNTTRPNSNTTRPHPRRRAAIPERRPEDPKKAAITAIPDPWDRQVLPKQPRPGYYMFLGECISKLTKPCGLQIFDSIYKKAVVDKPCCERIKDMGQLCSKALALTLTLMEKYKPDAKLIIQKSDEIYDKCVKDTTTSNTK